jgi:hypoxanthine phosphoribosyltransferase
MIYKKMQKEGKWNYMKQKKFSLLLIYYKCQRYEIYWFVFANFGKENKKTTLLNILYQKKAEQIQKYTKYHYIATLNIRNFKTTKFPHSYFKILWFCYTLSIFLTFSLG